MCYNDVLLIKQKGENYEKIDDMIRGDHENYKEYLKLKRKKAIQFKSKEDLDFVETEYSFRRKYQNYKVNIIFYTLRLMAILLIVIQLGFGGF